MWRDELEVEISIGTDIPDREPNDEIQTPNDDLPLHFDVQEDPSPSNSSLEVDNMQGSILCFLFPYPYRNVVKSDHLYFAAFYI